MLAPAVGYGVSVGVGPLAVTAEMLAPTVSVDSMATVPAMSVSAAMLAPTVALSMDFDILPAAMASTATMLAPSVSVDCQVDVPVMNATAQMTAPNVAVSAVDYDTVGAGGSATGASGTISASWSHTCTGNAVVVAVRAQRFTGAPTLGATYGGVPMTLLGSVAYAGANNVVALFGLLNPPSGSQTVVATATAAGASNLAASSVSYSGVSSFGTPVTNTGSGTSLSQTVSSGANRMVAQAFSAFASSGAGALDISAYNRMQRAEVPVSNLDMLQGDAPGAASVAFTATADRSSAWAGIGVDLIPG